MLDLIKTYYKYNSWATDQLWPALGQLKPEQYTAPGCSAHGSIKDTLAHFLTTQWGWFCWFDGSMTVEQAYAVKIKPEDVFTVASAHTRWESIDRQTRNFIDRLTDEDLNKVWSFNLPNGHGVSLPLWKMVFHMANHGTHTRAQIVAAIRRAGINPGNYEMINYVLTTGA